jgi:hypothetical protein
LVRLYHELEAKDISDFHGPHKNDVAELLLSSHLVEVGLAHILPEEHRHYLVLMVVPDGANLEIRKVTRVVVGLRHSMLNFNGSFLKLETSNWVNIACIVKIKNLFSILGDLYWILETSMDIPLGLSRLDKMHIGPVKVNILHVIQESFHL